MIEQVPHIDSLEIALDTPQHGWLPVRMVFGDYQLLMDASNVLNDPIAELIELTMFVKKESSSFRRVCLWLEPSGYAIDVKHSGPQRLLITILFDKEFIPPMNNTHMKEEYCCSVYQNTLYKSLIESLNLWLTSNSKTISEHWAPNTVDYIREIQKIE
jgi:hypothetical protein